jgi:2-oxo-4-hydroxy-4-carboxy--5-ureidoimidazoline (OHCU) decarboxylase
MGKLKDKQDWMVKFPFLFESDPFGLKRAANKRKEKLATKRRKCSKS